MNNSICSAFIHQSAVNYGIVEGIGTAGALHPGIGERSLEKLEHLKPFVHKG